VGEILQALPEGLVGPPKLVCKGHQLIFGYEKRSSRPFSSGVEFKERVKLYPYYPSGGTKCKMY
jgi:hypothetical protein